LSAREPEAWRIGEKLDQVTPFANLARKTQRVRLVGQDPNDLLFRIPALLLRKSSPSQAKISNPFWLRFPGRVMGSSIEIVFGSH
jgi:hypothetical protein